MLLYLEELGFNQALWTSDGTSPFICVLCPLVASERYCAVTVAAEHDGAHPLKEEGDETSSEKGDRETYRPSLAAAIALISHIRPHSLEKNLSAAFFGVI